jgi:hypothetical protein
MIENNWMDLENELSLNFIDVIYDYSMLYIKRAARVVGELRKL